MGVMPTDVGSLLATIAFAAVLFAVVIAVCVLLLAIIAAVLPAPERGATVVGADAADDAAAE